MANISRINGFRPVRYMNGAAWNGQLTKYAVTAADAVAIFNGDLVKIAGTADVNGVRGVVKAAVGDAVVGAVVGFMYNPLNLNTPMYRVANQATYVYVADDPALLYETQVSGTIAATDVGLNANHVDAGGSTTTGYSGEGVDGATKAVTATLTLKIADFVQKEDNEIANPFAKVLVKINNHQLASGTGTLGIA